MYWCLNLYLVFSADIWGFIFSAQVPLDLTFGGAWSWFHSHLEGAWFSYICKFWSLCASDRLLLVNPSHDCQIVLETWNRAWNDSRFCGNFGTEKMAWNWIQLAKMKASITRRMMAFELSVMDRERVGGVWVPGQIKQNSFYFLAGRASEPVFFGAW